MPFGFDPLQAEQDVKNNIEVNRTYLEVTMSQKTTGKIVPLSFAWEDGRVFKIDKVLQTRPGNSLKAFAPGWRYYCQTGRKKYYLHYDGERWYVEKLYNY